MNVDVAPAITAVANAYTATVAMVMGVLPSKEQQLEAFKLRTPLIYQRVRVKTEKRIWRQIKLECKMPVSKEIVWDYVKWDVKDLPEDEKQDLLSVLVARFDSKGLLTK